MFRDTSAQDRPIEVEGGLVRQWVRRPGRLAVIAAVVVGAAILIPTVGRLLSASNSVSASRLAFGTVERGLFVRDIVADGQVVAAVSPMLYASTAGTVTLAVHAGDTVARSALLATILSPDLTAKRSQEEATLQSQKLDYQRAQLDEEKQTLQVQDVLQRAQVDEKTAAREVERSRKAYELGAYTELQVSRAEDAEEKARLALAEAQKDSELEPRQARFDLDSRKAQLERQQVLVDDLRRQVSALEVRAPVAGQVGQIIVADKANVAQNAPLLSVVDLSRLELETKVPESFARDLSVGMPAQISGNGAQWDGEVASVSPEVVNGEVTARVRFKGDTPAGLRQNQRLSVRVLIDHKDNALTVARGSWYDQDGGHSAYVVHDGIAQKQAVRTGEVSIDKVEILDGLQPGDRIVVSGTDSFNNQLRVIISR